MIIQYKADDGRIFSDKKDCEDYERQILLDKKKEEDRQKVYMKMRGVNDAVRVYSEKYGANEAISLIKEIGQIPIIIKKI